MNDSPETLGIFDALPPAQLSALKSSIRQKTYAPGAVVIGHSETTTEAYFVLKGTLHSTTYSSGGREICYQTLESGMMFGELSAIDNQARTTNIIAQSECLLGVMDASQLWKLMQEHSEIMRLVLIRLTTMVRVLCSRVYEFGALGSRERTRAELLRLASNMAGTNRAVIDILPTHEDIANRIASHREAVTKELSYLAKTGLVEKQGKMLIIPDIEALSATLGETLDLRKSIPDE